MENRIEMAENEGDAKPTLRPFYKDFDIGRKFVPNGIETCVHKFFLGSLQWKPIAYAVSLESLAMENMVLSSEKRDTNGRKQDRRKAHIRPFYKDFERGRKFGPNFIETGVHKSFFGSSAAETKGFCS